MRRLLVWLLLVAPALGQQPDYPALAQKFAVLLQTGHYAEARQMFDAPMSALVSEAKVKQSWESMVQARGAFQKFGTPTLSVVDKYHVVLIPTVFARYRTQLKVVLTSQGQVTGYFWVPFVANRPPPYLQTKVREEKIKVGAWKLPGLLTFPASGPIRGGIVLVHGSGPNDMDEKIGPTRMFRDLARGLAAQGVVTLRYDKRTKAAGMMMALGKVTLYDEVLEDALTALGMLRARPELKGKPIVLLGHSLGAMCGPEIARRDGKLTGLILMAGPCRPFDVALIEQLSYLASINGPEAKEPTDAIVASIRKLPTLPDDDKSILGAPAYYWREVAALEAKELETARALKCKILVLQGGRDYQGTPEDLRLWLEALKDRPNASGKLFPNLNHIFAPGQGKATPQEYEEENYVDPAVLQYIGQWVARL